MNKCKILATRRSDDYLQKQAKELNNVEKKSKHKKSKKSKKSKHRIEYNSSESEDGEF